VTNSLKASATSGIFWSAIEKFSVQASQAVIFIVLGRLLMPEDFGLIGMLMIFIAVSQTFVDSGMGRGLIQKQDRTDADYSTVFVFNFLVSLGLYCLLFFTAPLIADFYNQPQIISLTRILTINLVVNSLVIVQRSKLIIDFNFKSLARVNFLSVIIGGLVGVACACVGLGVWSLVVQNLVRSSASVIMFWAGGSWKPRIDFSKKSFDQLFGFGSKLLLAGLYAQILNNVYNIIIGRAYSATDLGFYERAKHFAELSAGTVSEIMHQVTFPILASLQHDHMRMVLVYSQIIRMTAFVIFPSMTLLSMLAEPIVLLLLTEKWISVVVLLQYMCFARIFYPISALNMNILSASGRSDLFLKVDLSKFPLIVIALLITVPMGVKAVVVGHVITSCIAFFINAFLPGRLYNYGAIEQLKDMVPFVASTIFMAGVVFCITLMLDSLIMRVLVGGIAGIGAYLLSCWLLKIKELDVVRTIVADLLGKKI
jgi:O-antigen/teichoic acid export membrane protein